MWEHGLNDENYYKHPDTGESLPEDVIWMKDPNNSDVLSKLLSRYITNTMKDLYGVVDKKTGAVRKTQADLAQEYGLPPKEKKQEPQKWGNFNEKKTDKK